MGQLKHLPHTLKWDNEKKYKYVASFCLKCKTRNVDASKTIHEGCGGAVLLVHQDLEDPLKQNDAVLAVEKEFIKLETDEAHLNEMREKYKGFKSEEPAQ
jgi:hypothetical protein